MGNPAGSWFINRQHRVPVAQVDLVLAPAECAAPTPGRRFNRGQVKAVGEGHRERLGGVWRAGDGHMEPNVLDFSGDGDILVELGEP